MQLETPLQTSPAKTSIFPILLILGTFFLIGVLIWQGITAAGNPAPTAPESGSIARILDIGILVFREGLECILVL
jgi:high-affinity iron transporter